MAKHQSDETIDSIIGSFDLPKHETDAPERVVSMTFWLPVEYKTKYAEIQRRSRGKFGKLLKEVLKKSIDKVNLEAS